MKNIKLSALFFLVFFCSLRSYAQLPSFDQYTEDPVIFLTELKTTFEAALVPKNEIRDYMAKFSKVWNSPEYNEDLKRATYNTLNVMLRKRVKVLPSYQIYLNSVMNFIYSKQSGASFEAWQNCLVNVLYNESIKNFSNFLDMSENLFISNSFYKTPVYEYTETNGSYKFEYDKGKGPKVIFSQMNIKCFNTQRDSIMIYNTKGVYYPDESLFRGVGGKVDWTHTGIADNVVWAELKKYEIDLKRGGYTVDSAVFYHKQYLNQSITGTLTEKVVSEKGSNISYPRFESYSKKIQLPNIAPNVDYVGGFSMRGAALQGTGDKENKAMLIFKKGGKPFITAKSSKFGLSKKGEFTAELAKIAIYIDKDSIVHPSIVLKYNIDKHDLSLIRVAKGLSKTPFYDSYHKLNMYFEQMFWNTSSDSIKMQMMIGNFTEGALFESINYFRIEDYDALKGMDLIPQLFSLRDFVVKQKGGVRDFSGEEYGRYKKTDPKYILPALVYLAGFGFLTYDGEDDMIHVNDKVLEYIDAFTRKTDYDVILFPSFANGSTSAEINLKNYDMTIHGVKQVFLSDSQNVTVFPAEQKIVLKQNRNFDFGGVVQAGLFTLFGKGFVFDYDKFTLFLNDVDSVRLKVRSITEDLHGERPLVNVNSVFSKLNGTLEIDAPTNKSGIKPFSKYPIFNSQKNCYVYYDKKITQRGLYTKDKFYFYVDPFTIDSLDNFKNENLIFPGEMVSGDIFPKFRESLRLQPDYSLGFVIQTPSEGFPMYGNKATFSNTISLSNKGLSGDGTLNYVTSVTKSNNFIFLPDSVNATAQSFDIAEKRGKPEFPQVHGEDVHMNFRPYKDQMRVANKKDNKISSHNKQSAFDGLLTLTPKILTGRGMAQFGAGQLTADLIKFGPTTLDADTANFGLQSEDFSLKTALSFSTQNIKAHIDFEGRKGDFVSNGKGSLVKFPVIQYICFMQSFTWFMDNDNIEFGVDKAKAAAQPAAQKDINLKSLEFISIHPKQDSLRFDAFSAKFNPRKNVIYSEGVDYIKAADALVYPDSGKVVVEKSAVMRTFSNARIAANSITKLHNLYNCNVNITGRKKYAGSGYYDYIDETKKKQTFYFSNISVDTTIQTYAETDIPEALQFQLSPYFQYKGKVKLQAAKNYLVFDGYARLTHQCPSLSKTWFNFETEINPAAVYIPIAKAPIDPEGNAITAALMVNTDSINLYPAFLSPKKSPNDVDILSADGFIFYDKDVTEYHISNKEKLVEMSLPGNYLSLNTKNYCKIYGEGKINIGNDFGQVNVSAFGNATDFLAKDSTIFDMVMFLDFFFDNDAIDLMGKSMAGFQGLTAVDFSRPVFEKGMREMLGKEEADKLIGQLNLYGSFKKMPDELKKTLVLTDVKMQWNKNTNSFTSVGQIGVGNINKTQINKLVDGRIEIVKKRGGDILNIYLELDNNNWYYFNYTRGTMLAVSSNNNFNNILKDLKPDKRKQEVKGIPDYYFNICPPSKKTQFLRKNEVTEE